jgi:hypothetical protein
MIAEVELVTTDQGTVAKVSCRICKTPHEVPVDREAFMAWRNGKWAQDAFPDMNADMRELLISGTCPTCFAKLFYFLDEDEKED